MVVCKTLHFISNIGGKRDWLMGLALVEGLRGTLLIALGRGEWTVYNAVAMEPLGALAVIPASSEEVREGTTKQSWVSSPILESVG